MGNIKESAINIVVLLTIVILAGIILIWDGGDLKWVVFLCMLFLGYGVLREILT